MPEMPEVEVTRRAIAQQLPGARVLSARLGKPLRWPLQCEPRSLVGRALGEPLRRGKYLWLPLSARDAGRGAAAGGLLLHLGMSGSIVLGERLAPPGAHDHFDLVTTQGTLRLHDPRRFGAVVWSGAPDVPPAAALLARLGAEPFDATLTPQAFHAALRGRRAAIKQVLLAGDVVVGAGNIYACEALFKAGIDPRVRADSISRPRAALLLAALRETLARAVEVGGSTLRDFRDPQGLDGAFQAEAAVYGRAGLPCLRCGVPVRRVLQGQRATYWCARCQTRR
jgi:formamidopyrimidine-DNA glycosylase